MIQARRLRSFAFIAGIAMLQGVSVQEASAQAHSHGPAPQVIVVGPRSEMRIANQEAVLTYHNDAPIVFLHRYSDGEPTTGADVEATVNFIVSPMAEIAPGVYRAEAQLTAGRNDVELSYALGDQSGSAATSITLPSRAGAVQRTNSRSSHAIGLPPYVLVAIAIGLYVAISLLFMGGLGRRRSPAQSA